MEDRAPGALREIQLSVVVPVYGCADCLRALYERLTRSVAEVTDRYERG